MKNLTILFVIILLLSLCAACSGNSNIPPERAQAIAQKWIDNHPLYKRTVTGVVEFEPDGYDYDVTGLYRIALIADDSSRRSMWVSKENGDVFISPGGNTLQTGEEYYEAMYINPKPQNNSTASNKRENRTYNMGNDITRLRSSQGNVYRAPLELMRTELVQYVNIRNPEKVHRGCEIQILSSRIIGRYQTYKIDEDGRPGGTVFPVVDAVVIN